MDPANATNPVPGELIADVQGNPPAIDPAGKESIAPDPHLTARIERASVAAIDQHLSESPKRKPRGPDKRPRKLPPQCQPRFSVDGMGNGTGASPLDESPPAPLEPDWSAPPVFDQKSCEALVEIAINLLNEGAGAIVRAIAKKETGDAALAEDAAKAVQMSEKIQASVRQGAIACAKKYSVNLNYAPEIMLGGGLIVWAGQVAVAVRTLKAKGVQLRQAA